MLKLPDGDKEFKIFTGKGSEETIVSYQNESKINYDFDWGSTNITLLKQGEINNDIFIYWNFDKWKFGGNDSSMSDGELANFTYTINSTERLLLKEKEDYYLELREIEVNCSEQIIQNPNCENVSYYNTTYFESIFYTYPVIYVYDVTGVNKTRQYFDFRDICSENYSNCSWIVNNYSSEIRFLSDSEIDPEIGEDPIIEAYDAEHLYSNRSFYENIFIYVEERDNIWREIPEEEWLRVYFEYNLTNNRTINFYAKSNGTATIEVYKKDDDILITSIEVSEEGWYRVNLLNMTGNDYVFDFKVLNDNVEFDYIIDPIPFIIDFDLSTPANDTTTVNTSVIVNVSITNVTSLDEVIWNWNGTNTTVYNDNLAIMVNFHNMSNGSGEEIIIDDGDAGYSKTAGWTYLNTDSQYFYRDVDYKLAGSGSAKAFYTFTPSYTDIYYVYEFQIYDANRVTDAPYTVYHDDGSTTVDINQELISGWYLIGAFNFTGGNTYNVTLTDQSGDGGNYVLSDAVKITNVNYSIEDAISVDYLHWNGDYDSGSGFRKEGKYGGAYQFDGYWDYLMLSDDRDDIEGISTLTLSAWIKPQVLGVYQGIIQKDTNSAGTGTVWAFYISTSNELGFIISTNGLSTSYRYCYSNAIIDKNWTYVTTVYDGTNVELYINGLLDTTGQLGSTGCDSGTIFTGNLPTSTGPSYVGRYLWNALSYDFNGTIDEVRVWNRSLSASEIEQNYMMSLEKYSLDNWSLYVNQSKNVSVALENGTGYTYYAWASDDNGNSNRTEIRTISVGITDTTPPDVNITYPANTSYSVNVSTFNYTYSDTNPGYCWYTTDFSITNSTEVSAKTNFTDLIYIDGNNTWTVWCNDSSNNENSSSITFDVTIGGTTYTRTITQAISSLEGINRVSNLIRNPSQLLSIKFYVNILKELTREVSQLLNMELYPNRILNLIRNPTNLITSDSDNNRLLNLIRNPTNLITSDSDNNRLLNLIRNPSQLINMDFYTRRARELVREASQLLTIESDNNRLLNLIRNPTNLITFDSDNNRLLNLIRNPTNLITFDSDNNRLLNLIRNPTQLINMDFYTTGDKYLMRTTTLGIKFSESTNRVVSLVRNIFQIILGFFGIGGEEGEEIIITTTKGGAIVSENPNYMEIINSKVWYRNSEEEVIIKVFNRKNEIYRPPTLEINFSINGIELKKMSWSNDSILTSTFEIKEDTKLGNNSIEIITKDARELRKSFEFVVEEKEIDILKSRLEQLYEEKKILIWVIIGITIIAILLTIFLLFIKDEIRKQKT